MRCRKRKAGDETENRAGNERHARLLIAEGISARARSPAA